MNWVVVVEYLTDEGEVFSVVGPMEREQAGVYAELKFQRADVVRCAVTEIEEP